MKYKFIPIKFSTTSSTTTPQLVVILLCLTLIRVSGAQNYKFKLWMANFQFRNGVCAFSLSTMPGHDNAINPSSLPQTSSIITWRAKLEELLHEAVRFPSFVVTLGDFLYFNQGITPPCKTRSADFHITEKSFLGDGPRSLPVENPPSRASPRKARRVHGARGG